VPKAGGQVNDGLESLLETRQRRDLKSSGASASDEICGVAQHRHGHMVKSPICPAHLALPLVLTRKDALYHPTTRINGTAGTARPFLVEMEKPACHGPMNASSF
jgi:hypothetical protein